MENMLAFKVLHLIKGAALPSKVLLLVLSNSSYTYQSSHKFLHSDCFCYMHSSAWVALKSLQLPPCRSLHTTMSLCFHWLNHVFAHHIDASSFLWVCLLYCNESHRQKIEAKKEMRKIYRRIKLFWNVSVATIRWLTFRLLSLQCPGPRYSATAKFSLKAAMTST